MNTEKREKIKLAIMLGLIIIAFGIAISIMLKYNQEGEANMPFNLSEIIVVSSAEGRSKAENPESYKWNLDVIQYNDIYLQIAKNMEYNKNAYIESISVENFHFTDSQKGNIKIYMPNSTENSLFSYEENFLMNRSLTYKGGQKDNTKTLEVSSQGGNVIFRVANTNIGEYVSNDDAEIAHDGTLINKTTTTLEELKVNISFDLVIKTNIATYRGNVMLDLPCGDILTEGTSQLDKKDCTDIIFKRENY